MDILKTIKNSKNIRRIFGKSELIIIEKQLFGIKLKPSEKTRLSRDIRKKFEAIEELSPYKKEFDLKHGAIIKEIITYTIEAIKETEYFSKINKIYLFGSTAQKEHIFRSDIDIAVEFKNIDEKEAALFRIKTRVSDKVDLQVFNVLPDKIKKEIIEKGRVIYERKIK